MRKTILGLVLALCLTGFLPAQTVTETYWNWAYISAGSWHTAAIGMDGTLWTWGENMSGQLGDGTAIVRRNYRNTPTQIGIDTNWASVAASVSHTTAIRTDGSLWAWGDNQAGQLGDGTTTSRTSPTRIGTDTDWVSVSAGDRHTVAIKSDGSLWVWGDNQAGQLGDGTATTRLAPVRIGAETSWTSVSAGSLHTVAIRKDGTLWAWGREIDGLWNVVQDYGKTPVQIGTATNWTSVSVGFRHTVALRTDGSLWAWGMKGSIMDGPGFFLAIVDYGNTPVQIGTGSTWVSVSASSHTVAIRADGALYAWGDNQAGQIGDGTTRWHGIPVRIGTDENWIVASTGGWHTIALSRDGALWAWGGNFSGQLGDGMEISRHTPIRIWSVENRLVVWSFTDEIEDWIRMFNIENAIGMPIEYSLTPTDQFPDRLTPALVAGGTTAPDVFALESAFVRFYIESGLLLDLTDLYHEVRGRVLNYPVAIATHNGRVYGMSWQATPGAMFFRRSLARRYLGTDDPAVVQRYFANWDAFLQTARRIGNQSGGRTAIVSSLGDLNLPFRGARTQPWVVDGRLHIDPVMIRSMQIARHLRDNNLDGRVGQWSEGWFAGFRGELADARRGLLDVFATFLPTWGLHFVLATNAPGTSGDWAMIPGPAPWFWGGTWLAAYRGTRQPDAAREFIRQITVNEDNLEAWARETGDLLKNMSVVNRIKGGFAMPFLGGQNHYAAFADIAVNIDSSLIQGTDQAIDALFNEALNRYVNATATMEQAIAWFREQVRVQLGIH